MGTDWVRDHEGSDVVEVRYTCSTVYRASNVPLRRPDSPDAGTRLFINEAGAHLSDGTQIYYAQLPDAPSVHEHWTNGLGPFDSETFSEHYLRRVPATRTGPLDTDGDGLELEGYNNDTSHLFATDRHWKCATEDGASNEYTTNQIRGLADVNGDGLPDIVGEDRVRFGDGVYFGPWTASETPLYASTSRGNCEGPSETTGGLLDIDGDGRVESVRFDQENGLMWVSTLMTPDSYPDLRSIDGQGAGRLIAIENGVGAISRLDYDNNKLETTTRHEVPAPEVVLARSYVEVARGYVGTPISSTYYAYGDARAKYDSIWGATSFIGYDRMVTLTGDGFGAAGEVYLAGTATITDRRRRSEPISPPECKSAARPRPPPSGAAPCTRDPLHLRQPWTHDIEHRRSL